MTIAVRNAMHAVSREAVLVHARKLPSTPHVIAGLCELLQDPNTDLGTVAREIRVDTTLAARVIRMSNSAVFGAGRRLGTVEEAVNRVGFGEVLQLVGAATVAGLVEGALTCYGVAGQQVREASLLHALASEALATCTEIDARIAYTAGLLRGIGMMVLDRAGRAQLKPEDAFDAARFATYQDWELAVFGLTSVEVTLIVLDDWRFPSEVIHAVRKHMEVDAVVLSDPLACLLNLAGGIVAAHEVALPGEAPCWPVTEKKLKRLGIDEEQFRSAAAQANAVFQRQRAVLGQ